MVCFKLARHFEISSHCVNSGWLNHTSFHKGGTVWRFLSMYPFLLSLFSFTYSGNEIFHSVLRFDFSLLILLTYKLVFPIKLFGKKSSKIMDSLKCQVDNTVASHNVTIDKSSQDDNHIDNRRVGNFSFFRFFILILNY